MSRRDVQVRTADGECPASLHVPDGAGPWPAVILFQDAGGLRDTLRDMADRLTAMGYVTLVPDSYYRHGRWAPFDMRTVFGEPSERERLLTLAHGVTAEQVVRDAGAYVDYLLALPETTGTAVATTGYCMGGRLSLIVAAHLGDKVAAAAAFHAGDLADDHPDSPHHSAASISATVYVGGATNDPTFPAEQRDRLAAALTGAGVEHTIETYDAAHGFAVPDVPPYDEDAADRHWAALERLYAEAFAARD
ncbi:dienelactone hydrolase family protein [Mycolicibacterium sp.]|uniref:dienelactone hydrolase family protein n=1 Tax=Mycolicibacterium sp. TaxID=2320850 RepID=UPI003D0AA854